jgi:hypothetical protein
MNTTINAARHRHPLALAIALLLAAAGAQAATHMSRADYGAAKDRISADYKAERASCDKLSGNAKDICVEQSKGKESVARAELEADHTGKATDRNKVAIAKADAVYAVAKEECDDKAGNAKDTCVTEARAAHTKALADAKLSKKVVEARQDASEDKRDADYKVAAQKCDTLAGDAKSACVSDAKVRYHKN